MPRHATSPALPLRLWRGVAALAAGLVLLLAMSSVSPAIHAWLHQDKTENCEQACGHHAAHTHGENSGAEHAGESAGHADHQCAVTLFAHGVISHAAVLLATPCEGILRAVDRRAHERIALTRPRYLHLPPHAPPAA